MEAMISGIRKNGIARLPWTRALRSWQSRVMLLAADSMRMAVPGRTFPMSSLSDTLEEWLAPYLSGMTRLQ
jgi:ATP-dependent helicase HrpB